MTTILAGQLAVSGWAGIGNLTACILCVTYRYALQDVATAAFLYEKAQRQGSVLD